MNTCEIALGRMPQNIFDEESLFQVLDWCRLATSHYLRPCRPDFRRKSNPQFYVSVKRPMIHAHSCVVVCRIVVPSLAVVDLRGLFTNILRVCLLWNRRENCVTNMIISHKYTVAIGIQSRGKYVTSAMKWPFLVWTVAKIRNDPLHVLLTY